MSAVDDEIVKKAQAGDRQAMETLLEQITPSLYRFASKTCDQPQDAQEVLQDALLQISEKVPTFRGESSFLSWAFAVARSFCMRKRRRLSDKDEVRDPIDRASGIAAATPEPEEAAEQTQARVQLANALLDMPQHYREVVLLRDVEGLTAPEAAEVLDIPVATVKTHLHRGRARLRETLAGALPAPGTGCPDIARLYSEYLEGDVDQSTCEKMEKHLEGCGRCRNACDALRGTLRSCQAYSAEPVPTEVQRNVRKYLGQFLSLDKSS